MHDALDKFSRDASKYQYADIGRYHTVAEFLEDNQRVSSLLMTEEEKARQLRKAAHRAGDRDKKFLCEDGDWELWTPLTYAGSISLARMGGAKAEWCTAYEGDESYWDQYTDDGPLYIFIDTTNPENKYQLHFESEQFCDFSDDNMGIDGFSEFLADKPNFSEFFQNDDEYLAAVNRMSDDDDDEDDEDEDEEDEEEYAYNPPNYPHRHVEEVHEDPVPDVVGEDNIDDVLASMDKGTTHLDLSNVNATKLGRHTFSQFTALQSVKLPKTLQELGSHAFSGCHTLKKVEFPEGLKIIGSNAFDHCDSIRRVTFHEGLETIGNSAFSYCESLKGVHLPASTKIIGRSAFLGCKSLRSINLPEGLQTIHSGAFGSCTSLRNIEIPDSVQSMGTQVFLGCILLSQKSMDSVKRFCDRTGTNMLGVMRQRMWG